MPEAPTPPQAAFAAMLNAMTAMLCVVGPDLRYRWCNRAFANFHRTTEAALVGRRTSELVGPRVAQRLDPFARRAFAGETVTRRGWMRYPTAGRRYIGWTFAPLPDSDAIVVTLRDTTEAKQREDALAERTAQLEATVEAIADGISILGPDGALRLCNQGFLRIFDYPAELAAPGTPRSAFCAIRKARGHFYSHETEDLSPEAMDLAQRARVAAAAGPLSEEMRLGERSLRIRRQRLADGSVVSAYVDVTAERLALEASRAQRDALREAQQWGAVATALAGVGHELNNPLSVVTAQAVVLAEEATGTPLAARARKIEAAAQRCGRIVTSLMASARRRAPQRRPVALARALDVALDLIAERLRAAQVTVARDLPAELTVQADPDQLAHLLANLLGNATNALRSSPLPRRIAVHAGTEPGWLMLRVADNGPGIPSGLEERIFDPFFTTRPEGAGSGVGLALCRTIAQDHGGRIEVANVAGGGAAFTVRLPTP